jgi:hypothetical protein
VTALLEEPQLVRHMVAPAPEPLLSPAVMPPLAPEQGVGLDLILEGFLLHHARPRLLDIPAGGQRVLAGDYCYAQGLARVTAAGDLLVIDMLSALISEAAGLVARGDHESLPALWGATTVAIAEPYRAPALAAATAALRAGDPDPLTSLARGFGRLDDLATLMSA